MDSKGKGMVVNDKEKESLLNEPRDDKPTDLGSSHKKRDRKKKRCIKIATPPLLPQGMTTTTTPCPRKRWLIKIILLIILAFPIIQMCICYQFPLENLHTLMERTIRFGVIKCVVIYFVSILAYGKL
jgi:hypothetical protein